MQQLNPNAVTPINKPLSPIFIPNRYGGTPSVSQHIVLIRMSLILMYYREKEPNDFTTDLSTIRTVVSLRLSDRFEEIGNYRPVLSSLVDIILQEDLECVGDIEDLEAHKWLTADTLMVYAY